MNCLFIRVTQLFVLNISIHMFVVFGFVFFLMLQPHIFYIHSQECHFQWKMAFVKRCW